MLRNVDRKRARLHFVDKDVSNCSLELTGSKEESL
jgi:hypothetical protein